MSYMHLPPIPVKSSIYPLSTNSARDWLIITRDTPCFFACATLARLTSRCRFQEETGRAGTRSRCPSGTSLSNNANAGRIMWISGTSYMYQFQVHSNSASSAKVPAKQGPTNGRGLPSRLLMNSRMGWPGRCLLYICPYRHSGIGRWRRPWPFTCKTYLGLQITPREPQGSYCPGQVCRDSA